MNRRKIILIVVGALLVLISSYLSYKIWSTAKAKEYLNASIEYLPSMQFSKLDGSIIQIDSLRNNKELLVLNYFNPECDHCQSMVKEMFHEQALLESVTWLMITSHSKEGTKQFADSMSLSQLPNVTVLNDTGSQFVEAFGTVSIPSFYVYKNGKLLRKHNGECSVAYLLKP